MTEKDSHVKLEQLEQHDYSYADEEFEKNIQGYAESIGNFMIYFSGFEHTLELCVAELITERSDDLGLIIVRNLEMNQKIDIYYKLAFYFVKMLNEGSSLDEKIKELETIKKKLIKSMEFRNIIAHAKWDTLDSEGFVRVSVGVDKITGFTILKKIKITPDSLRKEVERIEGLEDEISEFWEVVQQIHADREHSFQSDKE